MYSIYKMPFFSFFVTTQVYFNKTENGAISFARIRSYLSTARKHGVDLLSSVYGALRGQPFIPQCN